MAKVALEDWYRGNWVFQYQTKVAAGEKPEEYDHKKMKRFVNSRMKPCHNKFKKHSSGMKKVNRKTQVAAEINKLPCYVYAFPKNIPEQPCCAMKCRFRASKYLYYFQIAFLICY